MIDRFTSRMARLFPLLGSADSAPRAETAAVTAAGRRARALLEVREVREVDGAIVVDKVVTRSPRQCAMAAAA
jgi:hypothetical protein